MKERFPELGKLLGNNAKSDSPTWSSDERERRSLRLLVAGRAGDVTRLVTVHNLSTSGMLIEAEPAMEQGAVFSCDLPLAGLTTGTVVWRSENLSGCSFQQPISEAAVSAALLLGLKALHDAETAEPPFSATPDFPRRLHELRTASGMSLDDVASVLGVSKQTIWYWEKGRNLPSPHHLVTLNQVFSGEGAGPTPVSAATPVAALFDKVRTEISAALGIDEKCIEICIRA